MELIVYFLFIPFRYNYLARHTSKSKIIYVARNPKNTAIEIFNTFYIKHISKHLESVTVLQIFIFNFGFRVEFSRTHSIF